MKPVTLVLSQGDPAGIGPEVLVQALAKAASPEVRALVVGEGAAFVHTARRLGLTEDDLEISGELPDPDRLGPGKIRVYDPIGLVREVVPGAPSAADAQGALRCLDVAADLAQSGWADALVTAPLNKLEIARHVDPAFRGHTDYLAARCGDLLYGRDYLMAFLSAELRVALLSTHVPLSQAIARIDEESVCRALTCLARHAPAVDASKTGKRPRIALAGLNPHAGEGGLLGEEDDAVLSPAVERAQRAGVDVHGPLPPDTVFGRARRGEFDWVLALYHDQGLIAVKTLDFGGSTNWTLGLPFLRTSVDHGTAYEIAGRGVANAEALSSVLETTVRLVRARRS